MNNFLSGCYWVTDTVHIDSRFHRLHFINCGLPLVCNLPLPSLTTIGEQDSSHQQRGETLLLCGCSSLLVEPAPFNCFHGQCGQLQTGHVSGERQTHGGLQHRWGEYAGIEHQQEDVESCQT